MWYGSWVLSLLPGNGSPPYRFFRELRCLTLSKYYESNVRRQKRTTVLHRKTTFFECTPNCSPCDRPIFFDTEPSCFLNHGPFFVRRHNWGRHLFFDSASRKLACFAIGARLPLSSLRTKGSFKKFTLTSWYPYGSANTTTQIIIWFNSVRSMFLAVFHYANKYYDANRLHRPVSIRRDVPGFRPSDSLRRWVLPYKRGEWNGYSTHLISNIDAAIDNLICQGVPHSLQVYILGTAW